MPETDIEIATIPPFAAGRPPKMSLRWSNDGGHTWSNYYDRDCGQAGEFRTRVRWLRLGSGRDFVFEISMSDPIPWRVVDGYINPGQGQDG